MLSRKDLENFKSTLGFNIWQIEKDYLQHLFLLFLSRKIKNELVFKGGTALQKIYGLNRFSIDLDFTLRESVKLEKLFDEIVSDLNVFGFQTNVKKGEGNLGETVLLKIKGPLYDGSERSISTLRIEVSQREKTLLDPEVKEVIPLYPDIQPYVICVMNPEEILAEKIRAIMKRTKARDIYDLWFLLKRKNKIRIELINQKLKFYGMRLNKKEFERKLTKIENVWKAEIEPVVSFVPNFNEIVSYIKESFREA